MQVYVIWTLATLFSLWGGGTYLTRFYLYLLRYGEREIDLKTVAVAVAEMFIAYNTKCVPK